MIYKHNGSIITDVGGKWLTYTPPPDEVTIGTQTWMSKNLADDDSGEGIPIIVSTQQPVTSGTEQVTYTDTPLV